MSHLNDNKDDNGIRMNVPKEGDLIVSEDLRAQIKEKEQTIVQLTAMCYTLARRLRNESFNDTITSVQRQQMAELAMQSLNMTPQVWELVP